MKTKKINSKKINWHKHNVKKIHIFGTSGSGKTFLSKKLSGLLKTKVYDLDDIFWKRKYNIKRDEKERNALLREITKKDRWIIEGCYSTWVEDSIKRSDLVIWLNPQFRILACRIISRFLKRDFLKSMEELTRGRQKTKEIWRDLGLLLKYAKNYHKQGQPSGYHKHKELIKKHKAEFVYIKNKRELNKFLNKFRIINKN